MKSAVTALCLLFLQAGVRAGQADTTAGGYIILPAQPGERCTVCGTPLTGDDVALIVRGRRVPLTRSMIDTFLTHQDFYFEAMQPKGALFQENGDSTGQNALGGVSRGWFFGGLFLLTALLSGGLSGYAGVSKGLDPFRSFFIGFIFNLPGYLYVLTRSRAVDAEEVPHGLSKIPSTRAPVHCPKCGEPNHPSAVKCFSCGSVLSPRVEGEVSRV